MSGVVKSPLQDLYPGDQGLNPENQSDNWGCFQKADFYLFIYLFFCKTMFFSDTPPSAFGAFQV